MLICNKCKKQFKSKRNYERHLNKKIKCYKKLQCLKCFKPFKQKIDYERHLNRKNDCSLDKYKIIRKNIQQELIIAKKDIEILKKENQIIKIENQNFKQEINLLKTIIQKHNIEIKGNYNSNIGNTKIDNSITLNIQVYTNHITPEILKKLEKQAIKIIKEGRSNLPIFDKDTEFNYSEHERICCQYLEDIIKYIWKNPNIPENNIIKYFENTYLKYSDNIDKWTKLSYFHMKEYILKTIYKICDKEKINKKDMSRKLKNILMHCSLHPKYESGKLSFNKTFFNLITLAIKKTLEII